MALAESDISFREATARDIYLHVLLEQTDRYSPIEDQFSALAQIAVDAADALIVQLAEQETEQEQSKACDTCGGTGKSTQS